MTDTSPKITLRKLLPTGDTKSGPGPRARADFLEGPLSIPVASCNFHMGNGGLCFYVSDLRDSGKDEPYQKAGPEMTISFSRIGGTATTTFQPSTEGLRELAFTLLKAAEYPFRSGEPVSGESESRVDPGYGHRDRDKEGRPFMDFTFTGDQLKERRKILMAELGLLDKMDALFETHASEKGPKDSVEFSFPGMAGVGPRSMVEGLVKMLYPT